MSASCGRGVGARRFAGFLGTEVAADLAEARSILDRLRGPDYGEGLWWAYGLVEFVAGAEVFFVAALAALASSLGPAQERMVDRVMGSWGAAAVLLAVLGFGWASMAAWRAVFRINAFELLDPPMRRPRWGAALVLGTCALGMIVWWFTIPGSSPPRPLDVLGVVAIASLPCLPLFGYTGHLRFLLPAVWLLAGFAPLSSLPDDIAGVWPWAAAVLGLVGQALWAGWRVRRSLDRVEPLGSILRALESPISYQRAAAAAYAGFRGEYRAVAAIARRALDDPSREVRDAAGLALMDLWGPSAYEAQDLWAEETGLARLGIGDLAPELVSEALEDFESIRINISNYEEELGQSLRNAMADDPGLLDVLIALATQPQPGKQVSAGTAGAMWLLGASGDSRGQDALIGLLVEGGEEVAVEAITAIGMLGPSVLGDLSPLLTAGDATSRRRAVTAMLAVLELMEQRRAFLADDSAAVLAQDLISASHDENSCVRREAVMSMGWVRNDAQRGALATRARELLNDSAADVRTDALKAVVLLERERSVDAVRIALEDPSISVRTVAVEAVDVLHEVSLLGALEDMIEAGPASNASEEEWRMLEIAMDVIAASESWDLLEEVGEHPSALG